jgi:glycosyltransferase involved in cell wall biosynthesis
MQRCRRFPARSPYYALEVDRMLRADGRDRIVFSASEYLASTPGAAVTGYLAPSRPSHLADAIGSAERLAHKGRRRDAVAHAFINACGPQTCSLNVLYANHASDDEAVRFYFLQKYFTAHGLSVEIARTKKKTFYQRLKGSAPASSVRGPLVTVVITACNAEATLDHAINSIVNQTWRDWRLIIVDDASTDLTLFKAASAAERDSRIMVLSTPVSVGPYACRNLAMPHCRGNFLTWHPDDFWSCPERLQHQVEFLQNTGYHACLTDFLAMQACGRITPLPESKGSADGYRRLCHQSLLIDSKVFREQIGGWDLVWKGGDLEMAARLGALGLPTGRLPEPAVIAQGLGSALDQDEEAIVSYRASFATWHSENGSKWIDPAANTPAFASTKEIRVDPTLLTDARSRLSFGSRQHFFSRQANLVAAKEVSGMAVFPPLTQANFSQQKQRHYPRYITIKNWGSPLTSAPGDQRVVFGINLISRSAAHDWETTAMLLRNTLRSITGQTDDRWLVQIVGHECPEIPELKDPRVCFMELQKPPPKDSSKFRGDKMAKRHCLGLRLKEIGGGYLMQIDADDWVRHDLVQTVLGGGFPHGAVASTGFAYDFKNGLLAPVPGVWQHKLNHVCGSCCIVRYEPSDLPGLEDAPNDQHLIYNMTRQHAYTAVAMEELGRPLRDFDQPMVVYLVNNSGSISFSLQKKALRGLNILRAVERHQLPPEEARNILKLFGYEVGGQPTPSKH